MNYLLRMLVILLTISIIVSTGIRLPTYTKMERAFLCILSVDSTFVLTIESEMAINELLYLIFRSVMYQGRSEKENVFIYFSRYITIRNVFLLFRIPAYYCLTSLSLQYFALIRSYAIFHTLTKHNH